ncbi:hypothetical protein [Calycomorphotria hydatis]|uniref:Sigma-70, region 4 n=1 Tax=Calycomorphotria hydatis TaxID=2528027 RepID=A0A517TFB0_9PLAN|nr:hypothetical protein [Calycomorphotria hydatis]QDT67057.1 hypothetical protein V22_43290 [Calycomorphotria hydatis]
MSVVRSNETKIILHRSGQDQFWETIKRHYAADDPLVWKRLAMLALRENAGWPLDQIAAVFGHHKGHVCRCIEQTKREMRDRFDMEPTYLDYDHESGFSNPDDPGDQA